MSRGNRFRALADLVTIDAWHASFNGEISKASLHTHVSFGTARIGDEPGLKLSFKLEVRRADVVLIVPPGEGLIVDVGSVAREVAKPKFEAVLTERRTTKQTLLAQLGGFLGPQGAKGKAGGTLKGERRIERGQTTTMKLTSPMSVIQSQTPEGHYRWTVEAIPDQILAGPPWDAEKHPRATLVDSNSGKSRVIEPCVRMEVRCLREDLLISDVRPNDPNFIERLNTRYSTRNNEIAAECFIRDELIRQGLSVGDIHNRFANVTIAEVFANAV